MKDQLQNFFRERREKRQSRPRSMKVHGVQYCLSVLQPLGITKVVHTTRYHYDFYVKCELVATYDDSVGILTIF